MIELDHVTFAWRAGTAPVLADLSLRVAPGESVFLEGRSGSGKTTLLNLAAGVLVPDRGAVRLLGEDLGALGGAARDRRRARHVGFVFQQFNLLPYLSLLENVLLPCRFSSERAARAASARGGAEREAVRLLDALGLDETTRGARDVTELSVGQQQRVALARALIGAPELVIADEPTSALDADTRDDFLALLDAERTDAGAALLFVSHDASLAARFDRRLTMAALGGREDAA